MNKIKQDFVWHQGEDLVIEIHYSIDDIPVNLTDYSVRMDMAQAVGKPPVFSFNSDDFDGELDEPGDDDNEITLTSQGAIIVKISRSLTLPGGIIGDVFPGIRDYVYDLFIRDDAGHQKKLIEGKISVVGSITKWS